MSGHTRYRVPLKKYPDIGTNIRIYGYRGICPNIGTCKESRSSHWPAAAPIAARRSGSARDSEAAQWLSPTIRVSSGRAQPGPGLIRSWRPGGARAGGPGPLHWSDRSVPVQISFARAGDPLRSRRAYPLPPSVILHVHIYQKYIQIKHRYELIYLVCI